MSESLHIGAPIDAVADTVFMPGDPIRAKFIAENFLENVTQYTKVRNAFGYTGYYKGKRVSVQTSGMGMPSMSIYAHELINVYRCKNLIRVGSAGSYQADVHLNDIVVGVSASTDSRLQYSFDLPGTFAPAASFDLLLAAYKSAQKVGVPAKFGNVVSVDVFYDINQNIWKKWASMGILAVEMEAAALYMKAAHSGVNALAMMTVSDNFVTGGKLSVEEREEGFGNMIEVALNMVEYL